MRFITPAVAALLLAAGWGVAPPAVPCPAGAALPSPDLYCIALIPVPALSGEDGVTGHARLLPPATPDGGAVRRDGMPLHVMRFELHGLPAPGALGPYRHYVAWVASPSVGELERLGTVGNGVTEFGPVARDKFLLLVTAEADSAPERLGRPVLRGFSPSIRLDGHAALSLPAVRLGASRGTAPERAAAPRSDAPDGHASDHGAMHGGVTADAPRGAATWRMPPMLAGFGMVQSLHGIEPTVSPYLPAFDSALPAARPRETVDLADGDTLRLTAAPVVRMLGGRRVVMFGFNGQYPGPLVRVRQGGEIVIDFRNELEWPSAVHWHGIRLENRFDGVPGVTQDVVPPGGRFVYRVRLPDAGIYWYHPHHREDVLQDLGLYGNILVRPEEREYFGPAHADEALILDDILIDDEGLLPYGREAANFALMGRFGNQLLVNAEPRWARRIGRGGVLRLFLTNAANTRTFNVSLPGARMKLVAADVGRFEREQWVESVVLAPAERAVVDVQFPVAGAVPMVNAVHAIDHALGIFVPLTDTLGVVTVEDQPAQPDLSHAFTQLRAPAAVARELAPIRAHADRDPDRELVLSLDHQGLPFPLLQVLRLDTAWVTPVEWSGTMPMMDWIPTGREIRWLITEPATGRVNGQIDWRFPLGALVKLRIRNDRHTLHPMAHPIHLHGQRFAVLARNGRPVDNLAWKDTALLPAGQTMDLLVEMSNPGRWMLHCHIAEHLETGMQMVFTVDEAPRRP